MVSSWKGPDVLLDWCSDPRRVWLVKLKVALSTPPMKIIYIEGKMLTPQLRWILTLPTAHRTWELSAFAKVTTQTSQGQDLSRLYFDQITNCGQTVVKIYIVMLLPSCQLPPICVDAFLNNSNGNKQVLRWRPETQRSCFNNRSEIVTRPGNDPLKRSKPVAS